MYVRWQSRSKTTPIYLGYKPDVHWRAILVAAVRVKGETNPRQQHVAYLGGITERAIENIHQCGYFWSGLLGKLDELGKRISPDDRRAIIASVAKRVACPTKAQFKETVRNAASMWNDPVDRKRVRDEHRRAIQRWPK
jgi:hypothetical protein